MNIAEASKKLEEAFYEWLKSDKLKEIARFYSGFHQYSFWNRLLILSVKPNASLCASFNAWKGFGRHVKKGEKGIPILVPNFSTVKYEEEKDDGRIENKVEKRLVGYSQGYTYDYEQTEGEPLPEVRIEGSADDLLEIVTADLRAAGYEINFYDRDSLEKGYTYKGEKKIFVKSTEPTAQQLSTLLHEWAHQNAPEGLVLADEEIVVQTASFFILSAFGLDSSEYTASYVMSWSHGRPFPEIAKLFSASDKIAQKFIEQSKVAV